MKKLVSIIGLWSCISCFSHASVDWKETSDRGDGIKVYKKDIPNSSIVALKGEIEIDAPPAKVISVLVDLSRMKEWVADVVELRPIKQISPHQRIDYNHTSVPWPLKDRDFVLHARSEMDKKNGIIHLRFKSTSVPEVPEYPDKVRADIDGYYKVQALGPKKTHVTVELHADPKGSIPKWVVNLFQTSWPRKTLYGARRQAQKDNVTENLEAKAFFDEFHRSPASN